MKKRPRNRWKGSDSHNCSTWSSHSVLYASVYSPMKWDNNSVFAEWLTGLNVTHLLSPGLSLNHTCFSSPPSTLLLSIAKHLHWDFLSHYMSASGYRKSYSCSPDLDLQLFCSWGFNVFVNCLILIFTVLCLSWAGSCTKRQLLAMF